MLKMFDGLIVKLKHPLSIILENCYIQIQIQKLEVVLRVNPNLEARGDFPTLEGGYTNAMKLITEIKT